MSAPDRTARPEDFGDWVRPHLAVMRRYAAVLDPRRDPDDVVQDALERAWKRWATFSSERGTAQAWLLAIVADRARRRRVRARDGQLLDLRDVGASAGYLVDVPEKLDLRAAIAGLPRRQREAVVLHYYVGLTVHETAEVMHCADGTVKSALFDARAALAAALEDAR